MIHYHGTPITPNSAALAAVQAGHAFISYERPDQLALAIVACQSFAVDNGAFAAWSAGRPVRDWSEFYRWARDCSLVPSCDFVVIPDVIDGSESENDALLEEWPLGRYVGAPVWHMHESLERLSRLTHEWPRVCLGSSGAYSTVGNRAWWGRMTEAMLAICDRRGRPPCKLHGLRMLNPAVFTKLPFSSADSTNVGRNIGIDSRWTGSYAPLGEQMKDVRAALIRSRIEAFNAPETWEAAA